MRKSRG